MVIVVLNLPKISSNFTYITGSYDAAGIAKLKPLLKNPDSVFYLAVPTSVELVTAIISGLKKANLITSGSMIAFEKPFGHDQSSARILMSTIKKLVDFDHIFLVDHYLTKELVKNIISLRFANPIIQHLWNKNHIQEIQINATETRGIDNRGLYYDRVGALRDMVQNHCFQLLSLITMDQPQTISPEAFAANKLKIIKKLRLFNNNFTQSLKIGQYLGYRQEPNVAATSTTETYIKATFEINHPSWLGVPITITTGKKLAQKLTEIRLIFKNNLDCLWGEQCRLLPHNQLIINLYPKNEIRLTLNATFDPGKLFPAQTDLLIGYSDETQITHTAYENVIADIAANNRLNSPSYQEILAQWQVVDSIRSNASFGDNLDIY